MISKIQFHAKGSNIISYSARKLQKKVVNSVIIVS